MHMHSTNHTHTQHTHTEGTMISDGVGTRLARANPPPRYPPTSAWRSLRQVARRYAIRGTGILIRAINRVHTHPVGPRTSSPFHLLDSCLIHVREKLPQDDPIYPISAYMARSSLLRLYKRLSSSASSPAHLSPTLPRSPDPPAQATYSSWRWPRFATRDVRRIRVRYLRWQAELGSNAAKHDRVSASDDRQSKCRSALDDGFHMCSNSTFSPPT